jgi:hypothetical protein
MLEALSDVVAAADVLDGKLAVVDVEALLDARAEDSMDESDEAGNDEDDDDSGLAFAPNFAGTTTGLLLQQFLVFPQHHFSLVAVPSHGVISCVPPFTYHRNR